MPGPTLARAIALLTAAAAGTLGPGHAVAQGPGPGWRGRPPGPPPGAPPPGPPPAMTFPSGTGRLRNGARGLCLDVAGWAAQGNANVLLWDCNEDPDHVWSATPAGELSNVATGQCLDAAGYDGTVGANVDVYRCEGLADQRWTLVSRAPGLFEIRNAKRGLCLDVAGRAGARGDNVLLWSCDGGRDQLWSWEAHAPAPLPRPAYTRLPPPPLPGPPPPPPAPPPPRQYDGPGRRQGRPMSDETFMTLVQSIKNESFSDSQLTVIEQATVRNYFRVAQLKTVIDLLTFSASKLRALELGAPRLVDPETSFALFDAFSFSADKDQARQILKRNGCL